MNLERRSAVRYLALGIFGLLTTACAADLSKKKQDNGGGGTEGLQGRLECVQPCQPGGSPDVVDVRPNGRSTVSVKLVRSDGEPLSNRRVQFELQVQGAQGTSLSTASSQTDSNGVASTQINAGSTSGTATVVANLQSQHINALQFAIEVSGKNEASYRVDLSYQQDSQIDPVVVKLYPQNEFDCSDAATELQKKRQDANFQPATAHSQKSKEVIRGADLPIVVFPGLSNGQAFTAVAVGKRRSNTDVQIAYGCEDGNSAIENGESVHVDITVRDHVPNIVGEYDVTHRFNLKSGLPASVQTVITLIGRLANDPGSFIFGCPTDPASTDPCSGTPGMKGVLDIILGFLPESSDFKETAEELLNNELINTPLRKLVNDLAQLWLENNAPDWVQETAEISGNITNSLKSFTVKGSIEIKELNIDSTRTAGIIPEGKGVQHWNRFQVQWTGRCDETTDPGTEERRECRTREFGPGAVGSGIDAVSGTFGGAVVEGDKLKIEPHSLNVSYGAVLVSVIERIVLPSIFGSSCGPNDSSRCNSIRRVLLSMINCEKMARDIVTEISGEDPDEASQDTINSWESTCSTLIGNLGDKLREYVVEKLSVEGGEHLRIGTPAGESCKIHQPVEYPDDWSGYPLPYIQKIGTEEAQDDPDCEWDVKLSVAGTQTQVDGTFYGARAQ